MPIVQYYRRPGLSSGAHQVALKKLQALSREQDVDIESMETETCIYVDVHDAKGLDVSDQKKVLWILTTSFEEQNLSKESFLPGDQGLLIEIGPRLNFSTAFSTNAVSICHSVGLKSISRIEATTRYCLKSSQPISSELENKLVASLHDCMTQCRYLTSIESFNLDVRPEEVFDVDVMGEGRKALERTNKEMGLAFDDWDLDYYTDMFTKRIKRNPTNVECFDLAQSNSEHSRHWFFKGKMVVDGVEEENSLFKMVMKTQESSNKNNVIAFNDNSSAIEGYKVSLLLPENTAAPSAFSKQNSVTRHPILTAETHNFPTGVAPFPGATTGTGGRIRDVQAAGRGAHVVAGTAGYCFGNLHIPGYTQPWEDDSFVYPGNFASPLEICIEASNGASDYGNKFGEPVLAGFSRSFGLRLSNGERREWVKPIMFSAGLGALDHSNIKKQEPQPGMEVVKIGGPVYRIGVGGGAASSIQVQGDNEAKLDFGAVQRGDAEMEQKLNRVIRACIETGDKNPICSIHDQGAGGNGNVLKEISEPAGAVIRVKDFQLGDPTLSVLELWGAEYQESNAVLVRAEDCDQLRKMGERERCPVAFVGTITGDGKIVLDNSQSHEEEGEPPAKKRVRDHPVDLDLECVLGSMPQKVFNLESKTVPLAPLVFPEGATVREAMERVLRLPSVASKRYLTNKVDRSVTGLVAQQQCVGPLHTPLADVAVTALSHFDTVGAATAIGEQPIKGLVDSECGARMSVGEALTNLVFAKISSLKDVKCSGNWMWAAKLPGEGAALVKTCKAMCDVMATLGIAADGGKDSLSMAARINKEETAIAPGALVISVYAPCPDIRLTVTPDLKCPQGKGVLLYVGLGGSEKQRLGGSAVAQCYQQIGDDSPDMDDPQLFVKGFNITQELIQDGKIAAGHDVSDGGILTTVLEMAFAGNCGIDADFQGQDVMSTLFGEELGLVLEVSEANSSNIVEQYRTAGLNCYRLGTSGTPGQTAQVSVKVNGSEVLQESMVTLHDLWEATSFQLERRQANPECVQQEEHGMKERLSPPYSVTFDLEQVAGDKEKKQAMDDDSDRPLVAVIREEGSNGDREMVAALYMAGFRVWDVTMQDLCEGTVTLEQFRGVVFIGGFSYADVLGSAKGWAASILFHQDVRQQFDAFYRRKDTFSLGVCNGCQLMALLGWVAPNDLSAQGGGEGGLTQGVCLSRNLSERFESRFSSVKIETSPSIMLKEMEGSVLGIWVAHGEGRMQFQSDAIFEDLKQRQLCPIKYVDDQGNPTTAYPLNPNGSPEGVAALCSQDGRHLAMMPHPERCVLPWQWAWMPEEWRSKMAASPWLKMFQNAYDWCKETA